MSDYKSAPPRVGKPSVLPPPPPRHGYENALLNAIRELRSIFTMFTPQERIDAIASLLDGYCPNYGERDPQRRCLCERDE